MTMSDEQLDAIEGRAPPIHGEDCPCGNCEWARDERALIAEVRRLRAALAAYSVPLPEGMTLAQSRKTIEELYASVQRLGAERDRFRAENAKLRALLEASSEAKLDTHAKLRAVADAARVLCEVDYRSPDWWTARDALGEALAALDEADPVKAFDDWNEAAGRPWKDRTPPDEEGGK